MAAAFLAVLGTHFEHPYHAGGLARPAIRHGIARTADDETGLPLRITSERVPRRKRAWLEAEFASDNHSLDFGGTFADLHEFRVPIEALGREVRGVAIPS